MGYFPANSGSEEYITVKYQGPNNSISIGSFAFPTSVTCSKDSTDTHDLSQYSFVGMMGFDIINEKYFIPLCAKCDNMPTSATMKIVNASANTSSFNTQNCIIYASFKKK